MITPFSLSASVSTHAEKSVRKGKRRGTTRRFVAAAKRAPSGRRELRAHGQEAGRSAHPPRIPRRSEDRRQPSKQSAAPRAWPTGGPARWSTKAENREPAAWLRRRARPAGEICLRGSGQYL